MGNKNRPLLITVFAAILVIGLSAAAYIYFQIQTPNKQNIHPVYFEIKPATSSLLIAENLKNRNLIKSKWLFLLFLKFNKGVIQAGTYEFSHPVSLLEIIKKLTEGQTKEWVVTFPEGFSVKDMAERLDKEGIISKTDFFKEASLVSKYKTEFPFLADSGASSLEGYLFPDTYRFPLNVKPEEIVKKMLLNFDRKVNSHFSQEIRQQGKTLNEILILASIVEREAKKEEDRYKIASVYLNRLALGMKLEADPTIQYAKGNWELIKKEDYKNVNSPYNTYKYPGLPPTPIANPGTASILAVLHPEKTDYLYFFHTKEGNTIYSRSKEEHEEKLKHMK